MYICAYTCPVKDKILVENKFNTNISVPLGTQFYLTLKMDYLIYLLISCAATIPLTIRYCAVI